MNLKNLYPGRMVSSVYEMDWEKLALKNYMRKGIAALFLILIIRWFPMERLRMTGQKSCFQGFTDWE